MSEPVWNSDMLGKLQCACNRIEKDLLSALLNLKACDKLTVGDVKCIAEMAQGIAFRAVSEGLKP